MIRMVGFDADDTLWHNEHLYSEARDEFRALLARYDAPDDLDDRVEATERGNLRYYGFGVTSFVLSLIETAVTVTDGRCSGADIGELLAIAKRMISAEVRLFDQVEETLADLYGSYPLVLITKGDLLHQEAKVARSGIGRYFAAVEVVADKTPEIYARVLQRQGVAAEEFVMVGNSMRSDILPVVELGGRGVYVPADISWAYEHAEAPAEANGRIVTAPALRDVPALIRALT